MRRVGERACQLVVAACLLSVVSCAAATPAEPASQVEPERRHAVWRSAGQSLQGRSIDYSVHGDGPVTVLLIASIHGDEAAGTPLLERLHRILEQGEWSEDMLDRRVVILPVANPDGHAANKRRNSRGVDLNRNFPSTNFRGARGHGSDPLSEPESRALHGLIERFEPDRVLSFHMAANLIDYDGPGESLAREVAEHSPMKLSRMGARPGSLGSYVGLELGRPILTIEQPASARGLSDDEAWELYAPLIRAGIAFEG